jgi:hypothetical protein
MCSPSAAVRLHRYTVLAIMHKMHATSAPKNNPVVMKKGANSSSSTMLDISQASIMLR